MQRDDADHHGEACTRALGTDPATICKLFLRGASRKTGPLGECSLSSLGFWWQHLIPDPARRDHVDRYIHLENLALFRKRLADSNITEAEREVILKLLADEEAREPPRKKN